MKNIFIDTGYWLGILNPHDQLHAKARQAMNTLRGARLVTSDMVLVEVLNSVAGRGHLRSAAARMVGNLLADANVSVVAQDREQFEAALERYEQAADKQWSLTDCASFVIMEDRGIQQALTHDKHFEQAGFEALLR